MKSKPKQAIEQIIRLITGILIGSLLALYIYMAYGLFSSGQWFIFILSIIGIILLAIFTIDFYKN